MKLSTNDQYQFKTSIMYKTLFGMLLCLPLWVSGQSFEWNTPGKSAPKVEAPTVSKIYTIQLGTFFQPKLSDFAGVKEIGQLYCDDSNDQFREIFLGTFSTIQAVETALKKAQAKGYSAFVAERPQNLGKEVVVIQLLSTQNSASLDWNKIEAVGKLYGLLEDVQTLKVVTGPFITKEAAVNRIAQFRSKGFKDAFVKTVNSQMLTPIGYFEKGITPTAQTDILADAIDRIAEAPAPETYSQESTTPDAMPDSTPDASTGSTPTTSTEETNATSIIHSKSVGYPAPSTKLPIPTINAKVKRTSALDVQKILKLESYYKGSLDGYYGQGTGEGYQNFIQQDYQYNKYRLVADNLLAAKGDKASGLQYLINSLTSNDAGLIAALERSNHPISKAYLGYWMFVNQGPSSEVNRLINSAIQESFTNQQLKNTPPFDFTATYDYTSIQQLLLHLRYLHAAPTNSQYAIPCWVFERHPKEATTIYSKTKLSTLAELKVSGCLKFDSWESIQAMQYFLEELQPAQLSPLDQEQYEKLTIGRTFLYLFPNKLNVAQKKEIDQWKVTFWKSLLAATNEHPLLEKYYAPLQILFYQSQVLIEDYYMQLGFTADEAEGLALSVLKTYAEIPLKVYLK